VDKNLFESLRSLRRDQAEQRKVPNYIVFGDAVLREMARRRPQTLEEFREIKGVGDKKCADYGELFTQHIRQYCAAE
jgi:ATP-dependent DNA helicase RecQ